MSGAAAALFAATAIAHAQTGAQQRLEDSDLRQAVAGKTVYFETDDAVVRISYHGNGTMTGRLKSFIPSLTVRKRTFDEGKWWIAEDRLCQRWNHWLEGESYCYSLTRDGRTVHWVRNDGETGTARID